MKHYINIENGVLKLMRTMPEKYHVMNPGSGLSYEYNKALTQAKADSVEIAPKDKELVMHRLVNDKHTPFESQDDVKDGIYEITTNGVFEVKHKGFFNGGKVEWVRGHAPTNDYEELAYYKEEAKQWEWSIVDLVNCARELMIAVSFLPSVDTRTAKANAAMAFFLRDYDTHGGRKEEAKPEQPEAESQLTVIKVATGRIVECEGKQFVFCIIRKTGEIQCSPLEKI